MSNCKDGVCQPPPRRNKQKAAAPAPACLEEPLLDAEEGTAKVVDGPRAMDAQEKKTLFVSIFTLVISIPALIGACCWPALVVSLVSGAASAASRSLGHLISFGVTLACMLLVVIFMVKTLGNRYYLPCCSKYGPLILVCVAVPFIMADISRHMLFDYNVWNMCGNNGNFPRINQTWNDDTCMWSACQYRCDQMCCIPGNTTTLPDGSVLKDVMKKFDLHPIDLNISKYEDCTCGCIAPSKENLGHMSFIGDLFTVFFTYFGFFLLAFGTMWNANIIEKCRGIREQWKELRQI